MENIISKVIQSAPTSVTRDFITVQTARGRQQLDVQRTESCIAAIVVVNVSGLRSGDEMMCIDF